MANPTVSIIVPVYNVEKYIRRCLDSIVAQTFTDWECILVDDGTPDNSGKICDEYAARDSRFVVIHKANGGVSSARNAGLDVAKGEWIAFVDADDWIESFTYKRALDLAKENNADLVQWNVTNFNDKEEMKSLRKLVSGQFDFTKMPTYFEPSMCAKVFKKTVAQGLRFPESIALSEDRLFALQVYLSSRNCYYTDEVFYHYYMRENSASHSMTKEMILQEEKVVRQMEKMCEPYSSLCKFIYKQKKECKSHIIFGFEQFDGKFFREIFPEIDGFALREREKVSLVYFLSSIRADVLANWIISVHKKIKKL